MSENKAVFIVKPGVPYVDMERTFDAPKELLWKAYTEPDMISKWWGGKKFKNQIDTMDVKKGGLWRFVQEDENGKYAFNGVYVEVIPNERLTYTFEFEPMAGHILMETITFEEVDGKTHMKSHSVYQSLEDRDGMVASGMEEGATDGLETLAELVEGRGSNA